MTSRSGALVLVLAVVGVAFAAPVGGTAGDVDPNVSIAVDGSAIDDGDTYRTGRDPKLAVDASVGLNASGETTLSEIVVRVNGNRQSSIPVNGTTASETVRPDLAHGNNTIRVIVTDDAGNVNATRFTVAKDARAPDVYLTSPYETRPWYDIGDGSVTGANATLAGDIMDDSSIDELVIEHEYHRDGGGTEAAYSRPHKIRDPGENFSLPLYLGYEGDNDFRLTVTDEFDNTRIYTFSIGVEDGAAPTVALDPVPNETSARDISVAGAVRDDVSVQEASVSIEREAGNYSRVHRVTSADNYSYDPDRTEIEFEESLSLFRPGTYVVTVNATDAAGNDVARSFTVERVAEAETTIAPEIEIDRDRTVVLDEDTLFLGGAVLEGRTERVAVETRAVATDETVDYQVVHSGPAADRVELDREVEIAGLTQVFVRATDSNGEEHEVDFFVNGTAREAFTGKETDPEPEIWPRVTVTPLDDGRTGTASSTVTVERASAGDRVAIPPEDGPSAVAAGENVTLDDLYLSVDADGNFTMSVTAREGDEATVVGPGGETPIAEAEIQHSIAGANVSSVTLVLSVDESHLAAHGVDSGNVTAYRQSDGKWASLETDRLADNDTNVRYRVESPGLSTFTLAQTLPDGALDGNGTAEAANETDPMNGTENAGNETATNESAANETDETDDQSANIVVSDVAVNETSVATNESVLVTATLRNDGDDGGTYTAGLQTIHEGNRTFVTTREAVVPVGESRNVSFVHAFAETGNHTVSVNGTQAGPVVVEGGGLLSTFAFVPLGLIGKVVAGLVGLIVVGVLVRAVLRRVGGGEASG